MSCKDSTRHYRGTDPNCEQNRGRYCGHDLAAFRPDDQEHNEKRCKDCKVKPK